MTLQEKAERFLRVNGVWDMAYADGRRLSARLADFLAEEIAAAQSIGDFEWLRGEYRRIAAGLPTAVERPYD